MRWYGPHDIVSLDHIKQAGCEGVVTALHHIPVGDVWSIDEILLRKNLIETADLKWSVVESLPVHDDIKKRSGHYKTYINNYIASIKNLADCGIHIITYNFMPVLDWMRTDLKFKTHTGALALRFQKNAFIAFDLFLLKRPAARVDYSELEIKNAEAYYNELTSSEKEHLKKTCLQALPGTTEDFTTEQILQLLNEYHGIDANQLRANLISFLNDIIPVADEVNAQLAIHPDDPPYPILGLPRIMSTEKDAQYILETIPAKSNGICFCSGSFSARPDNDLIRMFKNFGSRIHFLHFRSTARDENGDFYEANHLEGSADMYSLMKEAVLLMNKENRRIPMRPDHGHQMLDDLNKSPYPGYSAIGRLKGLAELRGLELGISRFLQENPD